MAGRNRLLKFEDWIGHILQWPFSFLPSTLEPAEVLQKLKQAMDDNVQLLGEGKRLAPHIFDITFSVKDHQRFLPNENFLKQDWQEELVQHARNHHYILREVPVLRLHGESKVRDGNVQVEVASGEAGAMATQALSAEQLAQLRSQLAQGQPVPGLSNSSINAPGFPMGVAGTAGVSGMQGGMPNPQGNPPAPAFPARPAAALPQAWLNIRLVDPVQHAAAAPRVYVIEKPVINIGRQLTNDIIVEDKRVSRYHAQIKYSPNGQFVIFDLGSTNGITINGTPHLRQHTLHNGDHFKIGSYEFIFERR
ncbi:MAG TPA: FhaA domain-containing protein [Ktedonobacteraceae bacterium]|nr:FhaA domain-containing protein [Ktedonobacteraceae bacterium]